MIPFELAEPRSFKEAISLLDGADETVRPIAGGTALMLMMKAGVFHPTRLIALRYVAGADAIELARDGSLRLGALATLGALERTKGLRDAFR
jgi:carbon-monoxide dehydrogenase medium subunit